MWDHQGCDQSHLIRSGQTRQYDIRPGQVRPDQTRPGETRSDQTRPDEKKKGDERHSSAIFVWKQFLYCGSGWQINSLNESNKMNRLLCRFKQGILRYDRWVNIWDSLTIWLEFRTNNYQQITLVLKFDIWISNNDFEFIFDHKSYESHKHLNKGRLS